MPMLNQRPVLACNMRRGAGWITLSDRTKEPHVRRLSNRLAIALALAFSTVIAGSAAIGIVASDGERAVAAWLILGLVVVASLLAPSMLSAIAAAAVGTLALVAA